MSLFLEVMAAIEHGHDSLMHGYDDDGALDNLPEGVTSECVEDFGGEDQGSTFYAVWKFVRGDEVTFVRFDGWYQSYNGAEYEECWEVVPAEKTVTHYEKK